MLRLIAYNKVYTPVFFIEQMINGLIFLGIVKEWVQPQLQQGPPNFILQLDSTSSHYHLDVRDDLNK